MENSAFKKSLKSKEELMENCDHLFIKLKKEKDCYGLDSCHNSCIVSCLKCGLTNKFLEMDLTDKKYYMDIKDLSCDEFVKINNNVFKKQFGLIKTDEKNINYSPFNLISDELWEDKEFNLILDELREVNNSALLYNIAKSIKPEADNEETFYTMKQLYEIQTSVERQNLRSVYEAKELIERYSNIKVKKLKYKNKDY